jgi:hypothetical protein
MPGIDKITSGLLDGAAKVLGAASKSKPMKYIGKKFQENPEKTLAYLTVGSIVAKDGIGCVKYVSQSLNNDKIPEKQRNFVAALDLTNGVLMIAAQILMFFAMRKFSEPIFNKLFKNSFNDKNARNIMTKIRMQKAKESQEIRKLNIFREYEKVKKDSLNVFKFVLDIAAATIIGKRVIVPFIATPLANKMKDKMGMFGGIKTETKPDENNTINENNKVDDIDDIDDVDEKDDHDD